MAPTRKLHSLQTRTRFRSCFPTNKKVAFGSISHLFWLVALPPSGPGSLTFILVRCFHSPGVSPLCCFLDPPSRLNCVVGFISPPPFRIASVGILSAICDDLGRFLGRRLEEPVAHCVSLPSSEAGGPFWWRKLVSRALDYLPYLTGRSATQYDGRNVSQGFPRLNSPTNRWMSFAKSSSSSAAGHSLVLLFREL